MKKPYLTQFERQLIRLDTLTGNCTMLRFRFMQLGKAVCITFTVVKQADVEKQFY